MSHARDLLASPVTRYLVRRGLSLVLILAMLVAVAFLLVHLTPGDPARRIGGIEADAEQVEAIRTRLGLTAPLHEQFLDYVRGLLTLDWGTSFVKEEPASDLLLGRFRATAQLAGTAIALTLVLSIAGGLLLAALTRGGRRPRLEVSFSALTGAAAAVPSFLAGTFLAYLLAVRLNWLPVAGAEQGALSMVLPVLAISLAPTAILIRVVRLEALNAFEQEFVEVAESRGVSTPVIYLRHVLPHTLTSALTIGGLTFGMLLGSTVVVENVFDWPGLGPALVESVSKHDYPVVQGAILLLGASVILVNALVDACLVLIDRRSVVGAL